MISCPCCPPEPTRRGVLWGASALAGTFVFGAHAAAQQRRVLPPVAVGSNVQNADLPLIDFHTHLQKRVEADDLVDYMKDTNVARLVLMPLYYGDGGGSVNDGQGSDEQARDCARRFPDRFVPYVGMQRSELNDREVIRTSTIAGRRLLRETEEKLASGEFFGMGEFMLRFYPYTNKFGIAATLDRDYPVDGWFMRQCADLSARYRAPMCFHAEAEPKVAEAARRLFEAHPQATFVWAHNCGRSSAADIAAMFERYPNLYADLGGMGYSGVGVEHYGVYWPKRTPWMHLIVDEYGTLLPDMKAVFERFSDRFTLGTDIAHARVYRNYRGHIPRWRRILTQLGPAAARNIAFGTADRLFRLTTAGRQRFAPLPAVPV
ncbi:MAG: amidohydrolase family protein [Enhydrobacter sp.]|nr:MAG: amidohydrolase family protein [Enhydrobacter sp.]